MLTLVQASRPQFWALHPLVFLGGIALSGAEHTLIVWTIALLFTFPYCLFLYGINDFYDRESDRRNKRKKRVLSQKQLERVRAYGLAMAAVLLLVSAFGGIAMFLAMSALLVVSYFYSAPPRLKERPPLDSLSNGFIYVILPFTVGWALGNIAFPWKVYLVGLCGASIHAITTIVDYASDKEAGDRTFATVFGKRNAAAFAFAAFAFTMFFIERALILVYIAGCAILALTLIIRPSEENALNGTFAVYIGAIALAIYYLLEMIA